MAASGVDIIAVTETWLHPEINDSEIFPDFYNVYRADRNFECVDAVRGGGVLLAVDNKIKSQLVPLPNLRSIVQLIDFVCCKLTFDGSVVFVFTIYIPPSIPRDDVELFFDSFLSNNLIYGKSLVVLGDFNVPLFVNNDLTDSKSNILKNFMSILNLTQHNNVLNANDRMLDLILSNTHCNVVRNKVPLVNEDAHHPSLCFDFKASITHFNNFQVNKAQSDEYNFRKSNFLSMYDLILHADWSLVYNSAGVDDACSALYAVLNSIFDRCVPKKIKRNRRYPTYYTKEIIDNIRIKENARKKYLRFRGQNYYEKFNSLRRLVKNQINNAYSQYIERIESSIKSDPKTFWSFINTKKNLTRIPGSVYNNGTHYSNAQEIVDGFGSFFHDVYVDSTPNINNEFASCSDSIDFSFVDATDIVDAGRKLNSKLTSGADGIPSFIVRDCIGALADPLQHVYNLILKTSYFPAVWKVAKVIPIHKKGDTSQVSNYRPISLLCNFSKIFEIILYSKLFPYVRNQIACEQHGFVNGRSCVTNLAVLSNNICTGLDGLGQVDVVYTDFQKAFDRINHFILLSKLEALGLSDGLVSLFRSYLFDRSFFVQYEGFGSSVFNVTSGVPQGSNLGPFLFNIFINDLITTLPCSKLAYADDLKLFASVDGEEDCVNLQVCLNTLHSWCNKNMLYLNIEKCNVVSFYRIKQPILYEYVVDGKTLNRVNEIKDLGMVFDSRFTFVPHIEHVSSAAVKTLGFIIRNSKYFLNEFTFKLLYFTFVRSKLEYGAMIWNPIYECHVSTIESVQRKFLKYVTFRLDGSYPPRGIEHCQYLQRFHIESLSVRRKMLGVKFLYSLLHNVIDCPSLLARIQFRVPRLAGRCDSTFHLGRARSNILMQCPLYFMCSVFNNISSTCDINGDRLSRIIIAVLNS